MGEQKKNFKVIMRRDQLVEFLGILHDKQMEMIELAVEKSDYKEAKEVIERVMRI